MQIDWGVVLLYGGGFALGVLSFQTGLAEAMGRGLTGLLPIEGELRAAGGVGGRRGRPLGDDLQHRVGQHGGAGGDLDRARRRASTRWSPRSAPRSAASLGFMLPVSTPCNAIVYGRATSRWAG